MQAWVCVIFDILLTYMPLLQDKELKAIKARFHTWFVELKQDSEDQISLVRLIGASEAKPLSSGWCETRSAWYGASIPYMEWWTEHIAQLAGVILVHASIQ